MRRGERGDHSGLAASERVASPLRLTRHFPPKPSFSTQHPPEARESVLDRVTKFDFPPEPNKAKDKPHQDSPLPLRTLDRLIHDPDTLRAMKHSGSLHPWARVPRVLYLFSLVACPNPQLPKDNASSSQEEETQEKRGRQQRRARHARGRKRNGRKSQTRGRKYTARFKQWLALGRAKSFRAGGWMIRLSVREALAAKGIIRDSLDVATAPSTTLPGSTFPFSSG